MKRTISISTPNSMPFASKASPTRYCKRCGKVLLYYMTDENGVPNSSLDDEIGLNVCHECYGEEMKSIQTELLKATEEAQKMSEPTEVEKKLADQQYEEAIKKHMEELTKNRHISRTDQ